VSALVERHAEVLAEVESGRVGSAAAVLRGLIGRAERAGELGWDEHGMLGRSTEAETQAVRSRARGGLSGLAILILLGMATVAIERDTRKRRQAEEALDVDVRDLRLNIRERVAQEAGPPTFSDKEAQVRASDVGPRPSG